MKFFVVGVAVALLVGLALGAAFSSQLRTALHETNGNNLVVQTTTAPALVGTFPSAPASASKPAASSVGGPSPSSSVPAFHGPTSPPHAAGPTAPPPGGK